MGIHGFVSKILRNWARQNPALHGIFSGTIPRGVSSLSIDANGLIHRAKNLAMGTGEYTNDEVKMAMASKPYNERLHVIKRAFQILLEEVVNNITPEDTLVIAVDGVVPMAKIAQQRERRYRAAIHGINPLFDGNAITTGTDFMFQLDEYIKIILNDVRNRFPDTVIYSSHLDPGEGEHKIMEYYRKGIIEENKREAEYHVLYGMDADLIMLSLLSPQNNIILVRESFDKVLDIELLKEGLILSAPDEVRETAIVDFVTIMMLLGNDFVPHVPNHTQTYETGMALIESYYSIGKSLTYMEDGFYVINYNTLFEILNLLRVRQRNIIAEESKYQYNTVLKYGGDPVEYYRNPSRIIEASLIPRLGGQPGQMQFVFSKFRTAWYSNVLAPKAVNLPLGFQAPILTEGDIDDMCKKYLQTIAWTLRYYQTKDINSMWFYSYGYAPLWEDVYNYIQLYSNLLEELNQPANMIQPILYSPIDQLIAVIPQASINTCIPKILQKMYTEPSYISVYLPDAVIEEKDGLILSIGDTLGRKDEGHLSVIIITPVNIIDIFISIRTQLGLSGKIIDKFNSVEAEKYVNHESGAYYLNELRRKMPQRFKEFVIKTKPAPKREPKDTRQGIKVIPGRPENVQGGRTNVVIPGQNYSKPGKKVMYNPRKVPKRGYLVGVISRQKSEGRGGREYEGRRGRKGKKGQESKRKGKQPVILM